MVSSLFWLLASLPQPRSQAARPSHKFRQTDRKRQGVSLPTASWGAFAGISHSLVLLQGSHQHLWQESLDPLLCSPAELLQNVVHAGWG